MVDSDWELLCNTMCDPTPGLTAVEVSSPAYARDRISALLEFLPDSPTIFLPLVARRGNASALTREATEVCQAWGGRVGTIFFVDQGVDSDQESVADFWREMNAHREFWGNLNCHILFFLLPYNYDLFLKLANHLADWMSLRVHLLEPLVDGCSQIELSLPVDDLSSDVARQLLSALEPGLRDALKRGEPAKNLIHEYYLPMLKAAVAIPDLHRAEGLSGCIHENDVEERDRLEWLKTITKLAIRCNLYDDIILIAKRYLDVARNQLKVGDQLSAMHAIGFAYAQRRNMKEAEEWLTSAVQLYDEEGSPLMLEGALVLNDLATLYMDQGRLLDAEPLFCQALSIRERALGVDHPAIAASQNNLAAVYLQLGLYSKAESLLRRALLIREKTWGADHPQIVVSLSNLAGLYMDQGRYIEADPLLERALSIQDRMLDPEDSDIAFVLNLMARLYIQQGRHIEAESILRRALSIQEKALAHDHPDIANTLCNLASVSEKQGNLSGAEIFSIQALDIREKALDSCHPAIATSLNNLATLYLNQGRLVEAEPLLKRALSIREKAFGSNHPSIANSLNNIAGLYVNLGRYSDADPLVRRALAIIEKSLGSEHPHTKKVRANLQRLLEKMKQG